MKYFSTVLICCSMLFACEQGNELNLRGVWVNANLDYISFRNDSIELGHGFDLPPQRFFFQQAGDTLILGTSTSYGDINQDFRVHFTYQLVDSNTLVVSSTQDAGFFGRKDPSSNTFHRFEKLFIQQPWDSLILFKYVPQIYGPTTTLQEKLQISSNGDIKLRTSIIDTLKDQDYSSSFNPIEWPSIALQISYIDTTHFHLVQSESQDVLLLEMHVYRGNKKLTFVGYDVPMIFSELRDFLVFRYKTLYYRPVDI